ncbi:aminopeptidase N [Leucothrix arctica]|uniref:Aminopeptidase N n=1 Tax=Leucothrix arctica TaxID=1481894 RepID=A0A317CJL6_9GAMM|nr:aminopeptidase N [Leucothrix arctica]PWQ96520.1 aminopeptidase N [Leucothrix arctica]
MKQGQAQVIRLEEYQVPFYLAESLSLNIDLADDSTVVTSTAKYTRHPKQPTATTLALHGELQELLSVKLDGKLLSEGEYTVDDEFLSLSNLPESFKLEVSSRIYPEKNTSLEGLYQSGGKYCTQCEAEGFRKITYFLDRPDVMTIFTTRITADKASYPVLLSNGNCVEKGDLENGRHFAVWHDPFIKPAYLFALVAGNLEHVSDEFTTMSGRKVALEIYTEAHNIPFCGYAMESLIRAMKWDEERFGLEYDLDIYMIVAVDDFNMGAMENKGLNVFNSKLVFASPETATDIDYINIEAVIGHEYFHNWTGNRVTCRDWFQLSLKEGLTVFRDQEFTADLHSRPVKRIEDVRMLRTHQFAEDASPMAHPIRPSSFIEINNFYTVTVYEKGAEVVRLYNSLLGQDGFRKGMDLYFERHDGQAVTTEDFLAAMSDANGADLSQMEMWYNQAGTPEVAVTMDYDAANKTCTLNFAQSCPDTPESNDKAPFLIPFKLALINLAGEEIALQIEGETADQADGHDTERVINITDATQSVTFVNVAEKPLPSLLRDFSAPVKYSYDYSTEDYIFLMQHDSDDFNRWEASQRLAQQLILQMLDERECGVAIGVSPEVVDAYQQVLDNADLDPALRAEALSLPGESDIAGLVAKADPEAIHEVRKFFMTTLANGMRLSLDAQYDALNTNEDYTVDAASIGRRSLKNTCLAYLSLIDDEMIHQQCLAQFENANNMTDRLAALSALADTDCPEREQALKAFEVQFNDNPLVMDKWFAIQAASTLPGTLEQVKALQTHPAYDANNPNKIRSLIGRFAMANLVNFHAADGSGYEFLTDFVIDLDTRNPQVASRMIRPLIKWRQIETQRSALMKACLERVHKTDGISNDVFEIVDKGLAG